MALKRALSGSSSAPHLSINLSPCSGVRSTTRLSDKYSASSRPNLASGAKSETFVCTAFNSFNCTRCDNAVISDTGLKLIFRYVRLIKFAKGLMSKISFLATDSVNSCVDASIGWRLLAVLTRESALSRTFDHMHSIRLSAVELNGEAHNQIVNLTLAIEGLLREA